MLYLGGVVNAASPAGSLLHFRLHASQMAAEQPTYASKLYCSSAESGSEDALEAVLSASASKLDSSCAANACFSDHAAPNDARVSKMLCLAQN